MKCNQIDLGNQGIKKNRAFLKALYETKELEGTKKWFDTLNSSVSLERQSDEDMTLDTYLDLMTEEFDIGIQICSPSPDQIIYFAVGFVNRKVQKFAWITCPSNRHNYQVVSRLFKDVYKRNIESVPVPDELR